MAAWVYILQCRDRSYYVGCTTDIDARIAKHRAGTYEGYTTSRLPIEVCYVCEFQSLHDAIDWERKLKRWTRAKKEAVIAGRWTDLPSLSLSRWRRQNESRAACASFDTRSSRIATQDDDQGRAADKGPIS